MMTVADIEAICDIFPAVTKDIKWEHHLCFNVGDKMFLVTTPGTVPPDATFKVTDDEFEEIVARPGFKPAPYVARHKWVFVDDINRLSQKEWAFYARQSYNLIVAKLPPKLKKQLGL